MYDLRIISSPHSPLPTKQRDIKEKYSTAFFQPRKVKRLINSDCMGASSSNITKQQGTVLNNHLCRSRQELCKFTCSCQDLSNIYLKASQGCQQSSIQPMRSKSPDTPSSPDRSRLVPLTLDCTRLARSKTNREPVRRLAC